MIWTDVTPSTPRWLVKEVYIHLHIALGSQSSLVSHDLSSIVFFQFEHPFESNVSMSDFFLLLPFLHPWPTFRHPLLTPHHSFPALLSLIGIILDQSPLDQSRCRFAQGPCIFSVNFLR